VKNLFITTVLKKCLLAISLIAFACCISFAQTKYYVNNTTGNDANNGTSQATPWKSVNKVTAMWNVFAAGDSVFFNKGDVFYGTLTISGRTGTALNPIVFSSYGNGAMPVIRASQPVTGWTVQSGNIWKATLTKLSKQVWNGSAFVPYYFRTPSLFINNNGQRIGREPDYNTTNGGFRTIVSHLADNSRITESANLPYAANYFNGAEVTIRTNREYFKTETVISSSGKNVNITATNPDPNVNTIIDQFGYFFQNHINTLNLDGEWSHDTTSSTLYLYSSTNPNSRNIEVPLNPSALVINNSSYVKVLGLQLEDASDITVAGQNDDNITLSGCYINNSNLHGIYIFQITNSSFLNNTVANCNNIGARIELCSGITFTGNTIKNVGMWAGMGDQGTIAYIGARIYPNSSGNNTSISNNLLDSIGYDGINMGGYGVTISQNEVRNFCLVKDDGGGIYTAANTYATTIFQNFVHDAPGAPFGAPSGSLVKSVGIYSDNGSQNQEAYSNTIYNIGTWGIMVNLSSNNSYHDNTVFNSGSTALCLNTYPNTLGPGGTAYTALHNNAKRNILFPRASAQFCATYINTLNPSDLNTNLGSLDSNYYCQPYTGGSVIQVQGGSTTNYTLPAYKTAYPAYEAHGHVAPHLLNAGDNPNTYLLLEVNPTASVVQVNLGTSSYVDALGTSYTGLTNIPAYGSLALIGTLITLPLNLVEFNAQAFHCSVMLAWKTDNEELNNYFVVERSSDGVDFITLGQVNGKGAGSLSNSYSFADQFPSESTSYYRLKIFDQSGKFTYSPVQNVKVNCMAGGNFLSAYPNPGMNGVFYLVFNSHYSGKAKIMAYNDKGQLVLENDITLSTGNNNMRVDMNRFSKGNYFINLITGDGNRLGQPQKILVQ
jgi:hypothetical protein